MAADVGRTTSKKSPFGQLLDAVCAEYKKIGAWNENLQRDLPKKWEKHGDMVLLPENSFTLKEWRMLGRNLWKVVGQCLQAERVGRKRRIEKDDYRSPHIELLYGQHGWVEHVDNGINYHYDVTKCMFSIGNINEKIRIASFDCKNEVVVDMFAGIGYFTLPYLVHAKAIMVHACEWNPDAVEALVKNLTANKVDDRCRVYEGDCRKVCPVGVADRVNLGLLPTARAYWLTACKALKETGGIMHVHENVTSSKLKKQMSRQESTISNSDVIVGDSVTIKYCAEEEEIEGGDSGNGKASIDNAPIKEIDSINRTDQKANGNVQANGQGIEKIDSRPIEKTGDRSIDQSIDTATTHAPINRRDSLLEEIDFYEPPIHENFQADWTAPSMDGSWKQFSVAAARRMRRFLNNLHDDVEWDVTVLRVGKIKSYAPRIDHIVLDLECRPVKSEQK